MSTDPILPSTPTAAGSPEPRVIRVSAVVMRNDAGLVLNVRKRGTASFMLPGGKPEAGEDPRTTAVREVSEELGLALDPAQLTDLGVFRARAANEPGFVVEAAVFEHPLVPGAESAQAQAEIERIEWIDPAAVRTDMAPLNTDFVFPALRARG